MLRYFYKDLITKKRDDVFDKFAAFSLDGESAVIEEWTSHDEIYSYGIYSYMYSATMPY